MLFKSLRFPYPARSSPIFFYTWSRNCPAFISLRRLTISAKGNTRVGAEICNCLFLARYGLGSPCVLALSGKSPREVEISRALKSSNTLKLPDDGEVKVLLESEREADE
ncbi:hypothetical protein SAY87_011515 [Trapa incisa]|uniref:Uncharacterized protein n=2 Tax=Trapa TaxID=22665 RepID=A0AAN7R955_TRANT|nr:hypothetical protein SAY87_011515 [Trapa incisa]KAK4794372.1 hypothetical protein SAY86_012366 [Trapa natans]